MADDGVMLKIASAALQEMIAHCVKEKTVTGNEACGFLIGRDGVADRVQSMTNVHASPTSYELNPVAQMVLQKQIRAIGLEIMAVYHSHVATQAYPSRRDRDQATAIQDFFDGYYLLVSLEKERPIVRAFQIRDLHVIEEEIHELS